MTGTYFLPQDEGLVGLRQDVLRLYGRVLLRARAALASYWASNKSDNSRPPPARLASHISVETAVELHRAYGPAQTTITDIAKRAGVEQRTVYNHFPDELSLFKACSAHHRALNPPPDPEPWMLIADPESRLRKALAEVYAYYRRNEQLQANVTRDAQVNPNVAKVFEARIKHQERMRDALAVGWEPGNGQRHVLEAALDLALEFQTWRTLVRQGGIGDEQAVELMAKSVRCAVMDD